VLGWPKRCRLAHVFLWEYSYKRLELAQVLGQLGVFLTCQLMPAQASGGRTTPSSIDSHCQRASGERVCGNTRGYRHTHTERGTRRPLAHGDGERALEEDREAEVALELVVEPRGPAQVRRHPAWTVESFFMSPCLLYMENRG
jgi:hypothetical protein